MCPPLKLEIVDIKTQFVQFGLLVLNVFTPFPPEEKNYRGMYTLYYAAVVKLYMKPRNGIWKLWVVYVIGARYTRAQIQVNADPK